MVDIIRNMNNSNIRAESGNIRSLFEKKVLGECKLTLDMLDERGNKNPSEWPKPPQLRGGLPYYPPNHEWVGFGLKVWDHYDNGNNDWIEENGNPNEWAIAYQGIPCQAVKPICTKDGKFFSTIEEGAKVQKYRNYLNVNKISQKLYPICGEGAYFSPHLEYAAMFSKGVIIMCKVNPKKLRIPKGFEDNEWIVDGTRDSVRPYRILFNLKYI